MQYKWTALTVTAVGSLMAGLDSRIVVVGLPTIARELGASPADLVWVTQAYLLSNTVSLLFIGRVTDLFGRVKMYNIGFIIFTIGSVLSSLSLSPLQLISSRVVQGIGAGMLITNASAIVTDASPKNELGTMLGINQTALRIGNVAGLTLSGLILVIFTWRGLFYLNIPIGIFGTIWAHMKLREIAKTDRTKKMDWPGLGLFSTGLISILLAITYLSYGISGQGIGSSLLLLGAVLMTGFVFAESKSPSPMLDLQLFKIKLFAMGNVAQLINALAFSGTLLLSAFYLQIGLGYTPLQAGLSLLPLDFTYMISTLVAGRLSDKYEPRFLTTLGLLLISSSLFAMTTFGAQTQFLEVAIILAIIGIGNGLFTPPNLSAIMGSVPENRIGVASGFRNTMFQIGATTSYGIVILLVTFGIPYPAFTQLLQGSSSLVVSAARIQFLNGFRIALFALAVIDACAIIPSAMRGSRQKSDIPKPNPSNSH
ncbi:MAG: MFS transporter [Nitrososphaerota archaeon]|nr:MFS transporter [Nitrososphaerota archaeon]